VARATAAAATARHTVVALAVAVAVAGPEVHTHTPAVAAVVAVAVAGEGGRTLAAVVPADGTVDGVELAVVDAGKIPAVVEQEGIRYSLGSRTIAEAAGVAGVDFAEVDVARVVHRTRNRTGHFAEVGVDSTMVAAGFAPAAVGKTLQVVLDTVDQVRQVVEAAVGNYNHLDAAVVADRWIGAANNMIAQGFGSLAAREDPPGTDVKIPPMPLVPRSKVGEKLEAGPAEEEHIGAAGFVAGTGTDLPHGQSTGVPRYAPEQLGMMALEAQTKQGGVEQDRAVGVDNLVEAAAGGGIAASAAVAHYNCDAREAAEMPVAAVVQMETQQAAVATRVREEEEQTVAPFVDCRVLEDWMVAEEDTLSGFAHVVPGEAHIEWAVIAPPGERNILAAGVELPAGTLDEATPGPRASPVTAQEESTALATTHSKHSTDAVVPATPAVPVPLERKEPTKSDNSE
ncbi:hypothetical protein HK104_009865, partial [Borealophlyctis nickersoniae]